jgi:hypothetical protein
MIISDASNEQHRRGLQIKVAAQTAVLVRKLRAAWVTLMDEKVLRMSEPLTETQQRIVDAIVSLVREEPHAVA